MPSHKIVTGRSVHPRVRFRQELAAFVAERGLTHQELSNALGFDRSHISQIIRGRSIGSPELAEALDTYADTSGKFLLLWELSQGQPDVSQFKERYQEYMRLESEAHQLQHHASRVIPGLLQTAAYARGVLEAGGSSDVDNAVAARIERRERLFSADAPVFRSLIPDLVLRTPVLDAPEWREQLELLIRGADLPNVALQLVPATAGVTALPSTDLTLLTDPDSVTRAWVETDCGGELISDGADVVRIQNLYDRVRDLAWSPTQSREYISAALGDIA